MLNRPIFEYTTGTSTSRRPRVRAQTSSSFCVSEFSYIRTYITEMYATRTKFHVAKNLGMARETSTKEWRIHLNASEFFFVHKTKKPFANSQFNYQEEVRDTRCHANTKVVTTRQNRSPDSLSYRRHCTKELISTNSQYSSYTFGARRYWCSWIIWNPQYYSRTSVSRIRKGPWTCVRVSYFSNS